MSAHSVHTFDDLARWPARGTHLGLLGHPVAHSLSPAMHTAALARLAQDDARFAHWHYDKFDIAPENLGDALRRLHALGFAGLNLTVPHKEAALDHIECADDFVRAAGAANTLLRTPTGWRATNTDGPGLADALREDLGVALPGATVVLLGAGGAARAAAVQCLRDQVAELWIGNRGAGRLRTLLEHLAPLAGSTHVRGFDLAAPPQEIPAAAILVNSTTLGLKPGDPAPVDLARFSSPRAVFDMIYNPPATVWLQQARALGLPHANGLSMLVHQGARALSLWTERAAPANVMGQAARQTLGHRHS